MSRKTIEEKISAGREYRKMQMEVRAAGEGEEEMIVEGYATTFDEEYILYTYGNYEAYEKIDPSAFENCDMSDVIMQYNHEGRVFARVTNETLSVEPDQRGLKITANLAGTELGRQVYEEIKAGYTTRMSFGFHVAEDKREWIENYTEGKEKFLRTITAIDKLYDVSAVSIPANDCTEISARSILDGAIEAAEAERLERVRIKRAKDKLLLKIKLMEV